jgi:hypothetical protein
MLYAQNEKEKGNKTRRIDLNVVPCVQLVTMTLRCVCELWHISRKSILNSRNMKSIAPSIKPKERNTEH